MDRKPDYYAVLGVQPTSSEEEIRKAFRRIAHDTHPDRNPGDDASANRFKEANEAHQVLSDPERRAKYDLGRAFGHAPSPDGFGRAGGRPGAWRAYDDLFNDFFRATAREQAGGRPKDPPAADPPWGQSSGPGADVNTEAKLSFEDSVRGCKKTVFVSVPNATQQCEDCRGSGCRSGSRSVPCGSCAGHGRVADHGRPRRCPACRGRRTIPLHQCVRCAGSGDIPFTRTVTVTFPAGLNDGDVLRVAGAGAPGSPPGNLFIKVSVELHPSFRREGLDVRLSRKISMKKAILGGNILVTTPQGRDIEVEVPAGSQPGDEVRVAGAGVSSPVAGKRGDMVVSLEVSLPRVLSPRGKKLLEELFDELPRTEAV